MRRNTHPPRGATEHVAAASPHPTPPPTRRCTYWGCLKRPSYGFLGGSSLRCTTHATDEMVDVKHKRCGFEGCMTIPSFGLPGGKAVRCVAHAPLGMVDVKNKPKPGSAAGPRPPPGPPPDLGDPSGHGLHLLHDAANQL